MSDEALRRGSREGPTRSGHALTTSPPRSSPRFSLHRARPALVAEFVDAVRRARALFRSRSRRVCPHCRIIELGIFVIGLGFVVGLWLAIGLPSCPLACCRRIWPSRPSCPCRPSCRRTCPCRFSHDRLAQRDAVIHASITTITSGFSVARDAFAAAASRRIALAGYLIRPDVPLALRITPMSGCSV